MSSTKAAAVVFEEPGKLAIRQVSLKDLSPKDCLVDIEWTGISTGTERLLWTGKMPPFPGLAYPLVPGYESVGRIAVADEKNGIPVGTRVFVPGSTGFADVHGLFGGAAERLAVPSDRLVQVDEHLEDEAILLALAATAYHAIDCFGLDRFPDLVVGHGTLGRLIARLVIALGGDAPTVWEKNPSRQSGSVGYQVIDSGDDTRNDYSAICDVSGDGSLLNEFIQRMQPGGSIVLAGFYDQPLSFNFAPAFIRESCIKIAAQWQTSDLDAVQALIKEEKLSLGGLISHRSSASAAAPAYRQAFGDTDCLKMVINWRTNNE